MRNFTIPAILALMLFMAMPASAAFEGPGSKAPGGFNGPMAGATETTVKAARDMSDGARVTLTGKITSRLGKDDYMFKDTTGEIRVDIDRKRFMGQTVTPEDTVRISGKVDKDFGKDVEIDVKQLDVIK